MSRIITDSHWFYAIILMVIAVMIGLLIWALASIGDGTSKGRFVVVHHLPDGKNEQYEAKQLRLHAGYAWILTADGREFALYGSVTVEEIHAAEKAP